MKPDGVNMETTETNEAASGAEPTVPQDSAAEQVGVQPQVSANGATAGAALQVSGKPVAGEPKAKPKAIGAKTQPIAKSTASSVSSPRVGSVSQRATNEAKTHKNTSSAVGKKTTTGKPSTAGAVPKRPATSTVFKSQPRVPDKSSAATSGSTLTNNTKPTVNGPINKRPPNEMTNGAKLKTAPASRTMASGVHKPTCSTTTKPAGAAAASKTTRPATSASAPRPASTMSRPPTASSRPNTGTAKPVASATKLSTMPAKSAASRVAAAPSNARTLAGQPQKPAAITTAKKDVCRSTSSAVPKKPTTALASAANRKPEPSKAMTTVKLCPASKLSATKATDPKVSQPKAPHPAKVVPTKKPVAEARFPANNKPPLSRSQPSSPANRPAKSIASTKIGIKPIQSVPPFSTTKKVSNASALTQRGASGAVTISDAQATEALVQDLILVTPALEEASPVIVQEPTPEITHQNVPENSVAPSPPEDLVSVALLESNPPREQFESPPLLAQDHILYTSLSRPADPLTDQTPSTSAPLQAATISPSQTVPPSNLNEEEDEEEREGSQLVSVSEMSGTTQLTEESRPESGGPIGGSAWRVGGALLSELDSEEVSGSHQGASELSAPGVLEGTESMDDLGEGSLKGAIDMEGASAGSPDFEKVPDIPVNDYEEEEEDDSDRVCDMDVGSERADEPQRARHDNDMDEDEDDDVEMASEGVTESGLESYGNADEDDFAEDERIDNLNRVAEQPPPPPLLPSAPAAQWDQPNPFTDPWAEPLEPEQAQDSAAASFSGDPWQADAKTPTQAPAEAWLELSSASLVPGNQELPTLGAVKSQAPLQTLTSTPGLSVSSNLSSETSTPEELGDPSPLLDTEIKGVTKEAELDAPASNPSSSSVTEDEASDTEGEALLDDSIESTTVVNVTFDIQPLHQHCLATVEEGEEVEPEEVAVVGAEDTTPPSATSLASYGFDTTASTSNAQSTGEGCIKSPGIFSLEELPEEAKEPSFTPQPHTQPCIAEQQYIECGKQEVGSAELVREEALELGEAADSSQPLSDALHQEENVDDIQPPYYSAIGDKTEDAAPGFTALPLPHRRDHAAYPRTYYDIVKPLSTPVTPPKLTCADLPPRSPGQQALSPQLRRLEQHQRHLLELQQRRAQQSRPLEEVELERKRRLEEEQRRKKEEAEEEIKRNKEEEVRLRREEELQQRKELELQLQQQQEEMKQRQQITQWQHELQQSNNSQITMLSPSSGLCTIYEALENSDEEELENEGGINELKSSKAEKKKPKHISLTEINKHLRETSGVAEHQDSSLPHSPPAAFVQSSANPSHEEHVVSPCPSESPEPLTPLELDWGQKVDIVQQLISQTLMLNGDNCSSLLLLPGGAGGTLSPLESSLWPSLLPPLTPPSATVTSVSSFSPEATGSSPQGEWTVVELETHH
ncbi:nuclear pore complex protein DDB_G0274915 [Gouania willdenowi]|uniref:Nuclear pore complex protein DDB_G0274915-like n=1 Tax=Gouania willdenowi TaxID=441366 RepID=A0A8C5I1G9_GOUWI|nr:nuclear pore complex protein DDB_G0274915-like [Gouania willdenowi]